jgi:hypothetical protein
MKSIPKPRAAGLSIERIMLFFFACAGVYAHNLRHWLSSFSILFEIGLLKGIIIAAVATITAITLAASRTEEKLEFARAYYLCKEKIKKDCSGKKSKSFSN